MVFSMDKLDTIKSLLYNNRVKLIFILKNLIFREHDVNFFNYQFIRFRLRFYLI